MLEILIAYLLVGWLCAAVQSAFFRVSKGLTYALTDYCRVVPLWPLLVAFWLFSLIMLMIRWGLDD